MFCNAHHAFLGPWIMSTLINEATPAQGLVTLLQSPTSVQPLPFVTGVVLVFAGVTPQFPGTSQRLVEARRCSHKAVFPSPPCFGEIRKFSCLERSGALPSQPQGEECALIGFLDIIRHSIRHRLLSILSILSQSWIDLLSSKLVANHISMDQLHSSLLFRGRTY